MAFWVWCSWLISLLLSPLHAFLVVAYVAECKTFHVFSCWLTYWHVLWLVFVLISEPSNVWILYPYVFNIFNAPASHQPPPATILLRSFVFSQFSQAICGRCPATCRVFAEFAGHLSFCFADFSPQSLGLEIRSKGKREKKQLLVLWSFVHGFIPIMVVNIHIYIYVYKYICLHVESSPTLLSYLNCQFLFHGFGWWIFFIIQPKNVT